MIAEAQVSGLVFKVLEQTDANSKIFILSAGVTAELSLTLSNSLSKKPKILEAKV